MTFLARPNVPPVSRRARSDGAGAVAEAGWKGVDRELFEALRVLRRQIAIRIGKPPYVVFNDETLRELARVRPAGLEAFGRIRGVGQRKLRDYGREFLAAIDERCREAGLGRDMHA